MIDRDENLTPEGTGRAFVPGNTQETRLDAAVGVQRVALTFDRPSWSPALGDGAPQLADGNGHALNGAAVRRAQVRRLLSSAEWALGRRELDKAWSFLLEAERVAVADLAPDEQAARATTLWNEVSDKLTGWRRSAARELLGDEGIRGGENLAALSEAIRLRNEHFHNQYHKLAVTRYQLGILSRILAPALVAVLLVVGWGGYQIGTLDWKTLLLVTILGATSGALGAVRDVTGKEAGRIPDQLADWPMLLLRPLVGAVAAIGVAIFLEAGLVQIGNGLHPETVVMAGAFLAGFSERWFLGLIQRTGADEGRDR